METSFINGLRLPRNRAALVMAQFAAKFARNSFDKFVRGWFLPWACVIRAIDFVSGGVWDAALGENRFLTERVRTEVDRRRATMRDN